MATQNDDAVCDVQFSLRVPKSMAEEITAHAQSEGMKPASWIRKAISKAIIDGDSARSVALKSDLLRLLETDSEIKAAVMKLAGPKDTDRERMREMEGRFKRLRKVSEVRLDDLLKQKKSLNKDMASTEKQIANLITEFDKLRLAGSSDADLKRLDAVAGELKGRRDQYEVIKQRAAVLDTEIEERKTDLIALVAESEQARVIKKLDAATPPASWQNDLERMEIQENMEDDL